MATIEEWASHTINFTRSRRFSREGQNKMMNIFLKILHPDRYKQAEQLSLNILVHDMWNAFDRAHKA